MKKRNKRSQTSQRKRRTLGTGKEKSLEDYLVELAGSAASEEAVQLDQQTDVRILASGLLAVAAALVRAVGTVIVTHCAVQWSITEMSA